MTGSFDAALSRALEAWNQKGRLADLAVPMLEWLLAALKAERAYLVMVTAGGVYRVRTCRNVDGESIKDPERWISHFALQRAIEHGRTTFYADTRLDRRFRTEGEVEAGFKTRSILVAPLHVAEVEGAIYCDSRFAPIEWEGKASAGIELQVGIVIELLHAAFRAEFVEARRRELERKLRLAGERREPEPRRAASAVRTALKEFDFHGFVTCSPPLIATLEELRLLGQSAIPIFIQGESGTGKELLARAVHNESGRVGPFLSLHCGAIPSSLVETELFGHKRGAFTGADQDREGLFQQAHGGTVFLDEVESMPAEMQVAFLRVLETGRFRPVSSETERETDVRVISTSQHSLEADGGGELRADLYYRLAGAEFHIPPLRERREDILLLTRRILTQLCEGRSAPLTISPQAEAALLAHDWPGNVRELQNLLRRLVALGESDLSQLHVECLPTGKGPLGESHDDSQRRDMRSVVDRAERQAIIQALMDCGGNKSLAARRLGLSRKTFYRRLEKHGIGS